MISSTNIYMYTSLTLTSGVGFWKSTVSGRIPLDDVSITAGPIPGGDDGSGGDGDSGGGGDDYTR